jgi:serine protease Do
MDPFAPPPGPLPPAFPPTPPSPPARSTSPVIWILALAGLGGLLCMGAGVAWVLYEGFSHARAVEAGTAPSAAPPGRTKLPPAERHVPEHALSLLDGCDDSDVQMIGTSIGSAIDVGAPLYNAGNFAGCYHMYEGTAADVERKLGASCTGPRHALEAGRNRAASLVRPSAQAWAMRDAFDGLLDVIQRREQR